MSDCVEKQEGRRVTVIMPSYNAAPYIETAVRSVMAQTYPHWRLLVLDDASADATCAIVQGLCHEDSRITLVRNGENLGVAKSRNRGLELAQGDCVAFLDSDDVWHPEKLEKQMQAMACEQADLVYTSYDVMDENGAVSSNPYLVPATTDFNALLKENVIGCSTVLLSDTVAKTYRFTEQYFHEDYCLWLSILQDGHKAVGCEQPLAAWRLASGSRSFDKRKGAGNRWKIYRQYLKLPLWKCGVSFAGYAINGISKYRRITQRKNGAKA